MTTVHIHSGLIAEDPDLLEEASASLSDEEIARGARFKSGPARTGFLLSRLLLRRVLADHLGMSRAQIAFDYNAFGKPLLRGRGRPALEFNLSHSHGRMLIAVSRDLPVGVDIEQIDDAIDPLSLAAIGLLEEDRRLLLATAAEHRHALFFQSWTRREACLKAHGEGFLRARPDPARTELEPEVWLWQDAGGRQALVQDLAVDASFKAAVAVATGSASPTRLDIHRHHILRD